MIAYSRYFDPNDWALVSWFPPTFAYTWYTTKHKPYVAFRFFWDEGEDDDDNRKWVLKMCLEDYSDHSTMMVNDWPTEPATTVMCAECVFNNQRVNVTDLVRGLDLGGFVVMVRDIYPLFSEVLGRLIPEYADLVIVAMDAESMDIELRTLSPKDGVHKIQNRQSNIINEQQPQHSTSQGS